MTITAAVVLFAVTWFLTLFIVLSLRFTSQQDVGTVVPGTPKSAPAHEEMGKKAKLTTIIATILWVLMTLTILYSGLTVRDFDFMGTMGP